MHGFLTPHSSLSYHSISTAAGSLTLCVLVERCLHVWQTPLGMKDLGDLPKRNRCGYRVRHSHSKLETAEGLWETATVPCGMCWQTNNVRGDQSTRFSSLLRGLEKASQKYTARKTLEEEGILTSERQDKGTHTKDSYEEESVQQRVHTHKRCGNKWWHEEWWGVGLDWPLHKLATRSLNYWGLHWNFRWEAKEWKRP